MIRKKVKTNINSGYLVTNITNKYNNVLKRLNVKDCRYNKFVI